MKEEKLIRLTIEIPPSIKQSFKSAASLEGKTMKKKTLELIEIYLKKKNKD